MDLVHDQLPDGRRRRMLTVVDQLSRKSTLFEVGFGDVRPGRYRCLGEANCGHSVACVGHRRSRLGVHLQGARGLGLAARCDARLRSASKAMENWYIEPFSGRLRDERLNVMRFMSLNDARARIEVVRELQSASTPQLTGSSDNQRVRSQPSGEPDPEVSRVLARDCLRTGSTLIPQ